MNETPETQMTEREKNADALRRLAAAGYVAVPDAREALARIKVALDHADSKLPWWEPLFDVYERLESAVDGGHYLPVDCPNCERHRVEMDGTCEKCHWNMLDCQYRPEPEPEGGAWL